MVTRRGVLRLGAAAAAAAAGSAACSRGTKTAGASAETLLWCWPGGLSDKVLAAATTQFAGQTRLTAKIVEGDYKQQLIDTLDKGGDVPAIVGIKGEDIASLLPRADRFTDLNTLGAADIKNRYLPWKWQQGSTFDGELIGFPIDIGPTAMFYRPDVFRRAGLPSTPAEVGAAMPDWPAFLSFGRRCVKAMPGVAFVASGTQVFGLCIGQATKRFVDEGNQFVGAEEHVRRAWDFGVGVSRHGLAAKVQSDDPKWATGIADGHLAVELGAAWHAQDLEQVAPGTSGKWRVAGGAPTGANSGGSFLAVPAATADKQKAFAVIRWLLDPDNQAAAFADMGLFPSTPESYKMPALTAPDKFFGGQRTIDVFSASAQKAHRVYEAPADGALGEVYAEELGRVELGKDPEKGWADATAAARALATKLGVN